tara:strand:- start:60 stop:1079 length:1020 start_codon:yes stop_codon:yes gene_type:complete
METTTSESIVRQAPYLEDFQKKLLESSFARGETPVDVPDIQVASIDPLTQQAMTTAQGIGQFQPYLTTGANTIGQGLSTLQAQAAGVPGLFTQAAQQATGTTGAYDPTSATAFMDPYQEAVTQDALAEMQRQAAMQTNQLSAQAVGAGAFGGSRQGIAQAELGRNLADIQSRRVFEDMSRNFNQAQNASQTAFENQQRRQQGVSQLLGGLGASQAQEAVRLGGGIAGLGSSQANIAGAGQNLLAQQAQLQSQLGALGQTQSQRELDAARQSQLQQSYEPFQRLSFMSDIFKPQVGSAQSTLGVSVAPSPSPLSQGIGLGVAGLSLNKALDNPLGRLFGS